MAEPEVVGSYAVFDQIAAGGMATVHLGRLLGPEGIARTVAIKRLPPDLVSDKEFLAMFTDEAMIVSRIQHPNVVPTVDIVASERSLFLVMEYIHGESLAKLLKAEIAQGRRIDPAIACGVLRGALHGLHAAHEARGPDGQCLDVVHRDVSPQNIIVGADGNARVLDFGVAKAHGRSQCTRDGQLKGKLAYMAPEQIRGQAERRSDVYAAAVVLWEVLVGRRLHAGLVDVELVKNVVQGNFAPPSELVPDIPPELDRVVLRGLAPNLADRYATAKEMANELERAMPPAPASRIGEWVERLAHRELDERAQRVLAMERASSTLKPAAPVSGRTLADVVASLHSSHPRIAIPVTVEGDPTDVSRNMFETPAAVAIDTTKPSSRSPKKRLSRSLIILGQLLLLAACGVVLAIVAVVRSHGAMRVATASAPGTVSAQAASATAKKVSCDPPFTTDDVGHRHAKPECPDPP